VDFKTAAREVLREVGHPLHHTNITEITIESGYLKSAGRTTQNTMRARLSVDVRDNPGTPFIQTAPGVYDLKSTLEPFGDTCILRVYSTNACPRSRRSDG
jgi:HB1/ASXL restriction endonuclease-like protein with HTH domain